MNCNIAKSPIAPLSSVTDAADEAAPTQAFCAAPLMERNYWNTRYQTKTFIWTQTANQFLLSEVTELPPGRVLDLAAGEGRNAIWLAEQGWDVHAVDFSEVAIDKGRQLAEQRQVSERIRFEVEDLRSYQPEEHGFDLIVMMYLQLPQAELAPIIARAVQAVAPGGTFLLVGHDSENLTHGVGGPRHPAMLYTAGQVANLIGNTLQIQQARQVTRQVTTEDGPRLALDCLVRGQRI